MRPLLPVVLLAACAGSGPTHVPQPTGEARAQPTTSGDGDGSPSATSGDDSGGMPFIAMGVGLLLVLALIAAGAWTFRVARSRL